MLKQRKPMARGKGFQRRQYEPAPRAPLQPATRRAVLVACQVEVLAVEKENPLECRAYRILVASLPCAHCGVWGHSQCAHQDMGKGANLKTDDRTCFPLCCTRPGIPGCHVLFGATGKIPRAERRLLEAHYGRQTRQTIRARGQWPKNLPYLEEPQP